MYVGAHVCVEDIHSHSYIRKYVYTLLSANQLKHVSVLQIVLLYTHLHVCGLYARLHTDT